jgi:hypothetical protein
MQWFILRMILSSACFVLSENSSLPSGAPQGSMPKNPPGFLRKHRVGLPTPIADIVAECFSVAQKFQSLSYGHAAALIAR